MENERQMAQIVAQLERLNQNLEKLVNLPISQSGTLLVNSLININSSLDKLARK